jgi:hypothetical protein
MYARSDSILFALSAACVAVTAVSSNPTVDVITGLPLTVYLPGAALVSLLSTQRRDLVQRQLWSVGASFGLTVAGGLVLNLAGGLTRASWLVWVGAVVVLCNVLKLVLPRGTNRVDTPPTDTDILDGSNADGSAIASTAGVRNSRGPMISLRGGVLLFGAVATCAAAIVLSVHTNAESTRESFVQAWVLPRPSEDVASPRVLIGIRNHLGYQRTFDVHVTVGNEPTKTFSVPLANGASWTRVITRLPGERVESTIFTSSQPSVVITRVYLATPIT